MLHGENILLGNIYAPNVQEDAFYASLLSQLAAMDCPNMIIADNFNCALCPMLDRSPPHMNTTLLTDETFIKYLNDQTDLFLEFKHM